MKSKHNFCILVLIVAFIQCLYYNVYGETEPAHTEASQYETVYTKNISTKEVSRKFVPNEEYNHDEILTEEIKNTETEELFGVEISENQIDSCNENKSNVDNAIETPPAVYKKTGYVPKNIIDNSPSLNSIIGEDNRARQVNTHLFPSSAIAFVEVERDAYPNLIWYGTAYLVGPHTAFTAGHVIYNSMYGWADKVTIYPGRNMNKLPFGTVNVTYMETSGNFIASGDSNHDWGILTLDRNVGYSCGYFGLYYTTGSLVNTFFTLNGYPSERPVTYYQQWTQSGYFFVDNSIKLWYPVDTESGQSGSPLQFYDTRDRMWYSLGTHTSSVGSIPSENSGVKLSAYMFRRMGGVIGGGTLEPDFGDGGDEPFNDGTGGADFSDGGSGDFSDGVDIIDIFQSG